MVLPGEEEDYMATTKRHERSKILHNFTFSDLKWGNQRILRCKKDDSDGFSGAGDQRLRRRSSTSKFYGGFDQRSNHKNRRLEIEPLRSSENEGIEEFREKLMSDLRTVADKMRESIFRKQGLGEEEEQEQPREKDVSPPEAPGEAVEARPWNLRKRRAACKALVREDENQYNSKGLKIEEKQVMYKSNLGNESVNSTKPKFLSTLSKKEIEDDFMKMMGHRPLRRPKKRLRTVQKHVDLLKPALYFSEITEDIY